MANNGNMNGNQINGLDGPMTQELHLKMSKKIAQLTKVVYALNTKNDEHEAHVLCLQEAHELELKKVLNSTEEQIAKLQTLVAHQRNDQEIIVDLRNRIKEYEHNNTTAVREFKSYKTNTQERENELRHGYDEQMKSLKGELEALREDYKTKVGEFSDRSSQNDTSSSMLRAMKEKHEKELELLKEVSEQQEANNEKNRLDLIRHHSTELSALRQKHREEMGAMVNSEKSSLTALYKTQIAQLEEEVSTLKQVMEQGDHQSSNKISLLTKDLEEAESKFANYTEEREKLENENQKLQAEINDLEEKFMETRRDLDIALQQIARVEEDLSMQQKAALQQTEENLQKAGQIGMLDELTQLHSVENEKLQFEIKKLKDKITEKDDEIRHIKEKHTKTINIWEDKSTQLKKDITVKDEEIARLKAEYKLSLEEHIAAATEREAELQKYKLDEIREIKESSERDIEEVLEASRANTQAIREALEAEAASEKHVLKTSYEAQIEELTLERNELESRVNSLTTELDDLRRTMSSNASSLSETQKERQDLLNSIKEKQSHLELLHSELKDKVQVLQSLRKEFDKEVEAHDRTKKQSEQYAADQVAACRKELNEYWDKKLKDELDELEQELMRRQSQSRNSEIRKMKDIHVQEFIDAETMWKEKLESLQTKIGGLEKQLSVLNIQSLKKEMNMNERSKSEYEELTAKLYHLRVEHAAHIREIEEEHKDALKRLEESMLRDAKNMEDKLVLSHRQNMHELTKANKLSVDALKDQMEQKRMMDLNSYKHSARKELEQQITKCKKECSDQSDLRVHEVTLSYEEQKEELQRELEMRDREMKQFHTKMGELQNQLTDKQLVLSQYRDDVENLKHQLQDMQYQYEDKSKEVVHIKQEAIMQIKKREKRLSALHQSEIKGVQLRFTKDVDDINFKHQNEIQNLRLQMGELHGQLASADERYNNRPSRPEDLTKILELKNGIVEADERIKHLIDEKKFYELELVNRESNYNKVFNCAPKIGVINPRVKTKANKRRSETAMRNNPNTSPNVPVANSFSSPILPNAPNTNNKPKAKLVPISSRASSLESLVAQTMSSSTNSASVRPLPARRVVKNAFLDTSESVVPPT